MAGARARRRRVHQSAAWRRDPARCADLRIRPSGRARCHRASPAFRRQSHPRRARRLRSCRAHASARCRRRHLGSHSLHRRAPRHRHLARSRRLLAHETGARSRRRPARRRAARDGGIGVKRLAGTGWSLGGKTGTGPDVVGPTSNGWFAGVLFRGDEPRYTFAVFVERRGPGGGVAASIAADLASNLVQRSSSTHPR